MTGILVVGAGEGDAALLDALVAAGLDVDRFAANAPSGRSPVARLNLGLAHALATGRDALLLDGNARLDAAAVAEMVAVAALDPTIGLVGARTSGGAALRERLPRFSTMPALPAANLLVRHAMPREFGLLDEAYRGADAAVADFLRRCNRRGYRAAIANGAYAEGAAAAAVSDPADADLLAARYPEHERAIAYRADSAAARAAALATGLVPRADGRLGLLFDCRMLEPFHNGTFEHLARLLAAFVPLVADRYVVAAMVGDEAWRFHGLDGIAGLARHRDGDGASAIAFRIGQPFIREDILVLADRAPITGFLMLDTIALDCAHVSVHDLDKLWRVMADVVALIGFNSEASRAQFRRRFPRGGGGALDFVSRCSTDVADYAAPSPVAAEPGGVLIVGNGYEHKHVAATLAALRVRAPGLPVRALGMAGDADALGDAALGDISQAEATARYRAADVILYPSHAEGFGLPILHALAAGTPVVARDLPPAREIAARSPYAANIHLAPDTETLVALAADPPAWVAEPVTPPHPPESWRDAAAALAAAFDAAVADFDFEACVARQSRLAWLRGTLEADGRTHQADARAEAGEAAAAAEAEWAVAALAAAGRAEALSAYGVGGEPADGDAMPLAAAIVAARRARPREAWRRRVLSHLPGRAFSADAALGAPPAGTGADLSLDGRDMPDRDEFALALFGWAGVVAVGGAVRLACARVRERDASCALLAAGLCPVRTVRRRRRVEIEAVKAIDWAAALPGPSDDALFVTIACRRALGRDPDDAEAAQLRAALAGETREAVLARLYASPARTRLIEALLARLSGAAERFDDSSG